MVIPCHPVEIREEVLIFLRAVSCEGSTIFYRRRVEGELLFEYKNCEFEMFEIFYNLGESSKLFQSLKNVEIPVYWKFEFSILS